MNNTSKSYEGLQIVQATDIRDLVDECLACNINLLIYGEPGCGKSSIIEGLATEYNVIMLGCASLCEEAINGIPVYDSATKTTPYAKPEWLIKMQQHHATEPDKPIVLFLDEITLARPEVANSIQILLTDRALPTHPDDKLPDNCVIVSATNTVADTTEGFELSRPLKTRFMTVRMVNTPDNFKRYVMSIAGDKLPNLLNGMGEERFKTFLNDTISDFSMHWCDNTEFYGTNPRTIMNFYKSCDYAIAKTGHLSATEATRKAERTTGHKITKFNWYDGDDFTVKANGTNSLPTLEAINAMGISELRNACRTLATSTRATSTPVIKTICAISERIKMLEKEAKEHEAEEQ